MEQRLGFGDMKQSQVIILAFCLMPATFGSVSFADTFANHQTKELLHGYAKTQMENGKTVVQTQEKGEVKLNLGEWQVIADREGRNSKVIVLTIDSRIMLEIEAEALIKAMARASDKGPLFILVEVDTPGGRVDLTKRICGAITQTWNCQAVAFVKGGKYGGAISAGAAVAFACDKIYMADNTVIGAAAPLVLSEGSPKDVKETFGEDIGEKISSAWRAYLASLAEQNNRPTLLAGAMVDKELEVIEVLEADKRLFIDPADKTPQQHVVQTWSKKGSLLTLTAEQAAECAIADKVVNSRRELLRHLNARDAEIVIDDSFQKAKKLFRRAELRFAKLTKSLDLRIKQMKQTRVRTRALKMLRDIRKDYKSLIALAKRYPDLQIDVEFLQRQLNSAEAMYKEMKMRR
jgi:membrane-bound ClpP family serine protease